MASICKMNYNTSEDTKSLMKKLNKEWREYTKQIDEIIGSQDIPLQKNVTFIIRRRKGCNISLGDILESELKKLDKIIDELYKN